MKVFNLRCGNGHGFEGWFASEDDFLDQNGRVLVECPLCADRIIKRMPSAPRLNLSATSEPAATTPATTVPMLDLQAAWLHVVRQVLANTEDVGERFADEARRIHYGESAQRGIRGQATAEQKAELLDEGIEVVSLPLPRGLEGPLQ